MTTLTVTQARKKLYQIVDDANTTHDEIHIVGKRGGAVVVSEEDWSAIKETLYLLSIPGMRKSIQEGLRAPISKCAKALKW